MTRVDPLILSPEQLGMMATKQLCHQKPDLFPGKAYWINYDKYSVTKDEASKTYVCAGTGTLCTRRLDTGDILVPKKVEVFISFTVGKDPLGMPTVILGTVIIEPV
jgi:hypothetical protein